MKKRLLAAALCVVMMFSVSACSKDEETKKTEGKISLQNYKGYTVGESLKEISDKEIEEYVQDVVAVFATTNDVTEGTLKKDDKVKVTYKETNEVTKEDEKGTTTTVTLNDEGFAVEGFTDKLIGHKVGETVEMDLTYPKDYSDEDLAGKAVHFSVKIDAIRVTTTPDFTDAFVKEKFSFAGLETAQAFREMIKEELYVIDINEKVWQDIVAAQKIDSYPSDELQGYVDLSYSQLESAMAMYGYNMNTYLQMVDQTKEELMDELTENCKKIVKENMFVRAVAEKEGIKYSEKEAAKYAAISGFTSVKELKEYIEQYGEDLELRVLSYQVQNFIAENVKFIPDAETTTSEEDKEAETTTKSEQTSAEADTTKKEETTTPAQ